VINVAKNPIPDKKRVELNNLLARLDDVQHDIEIAVQAEIPGADRARDACDVCRRNIVKIKAAYFPNKA
jgi:hypothetical protein